LICQNKFAYLNFSSAYKKRLLLFMPGAQSIEFHGRGYFML